MKLSVEVRTNRALKAIFKRRPKAVAFAWDRATLLAAKLLKEQLMKQWARNVKKQRRKSFIGSALVARRTGNSNFSAGQVVRFSTGRVYSRFGDQTFELALRGGVKRPEKATRFIVPLSSFGRRITPAVRRKMYRAGDLLLYRRGRQSVPIATLHRRVEVDKYWFVEVPLRRIRKATPRIVLRELQKEFRALQRRS